LDSAHNTYSMGKLVEALKTLAGNRPITFVFGCMADKDIEGMLDAMLLVARRVIFTQAELARAASAQDLLALAAHIVAEGWQGEGDRPDLLALPTIAESVAYALAHTPPGEAICVAGSLAVAGAARTALQGSAEC
jgi:dihydrofolate synthase/folylpolyglutamate synthase